MKCLVVLGLACLWFLTRVSADSMGTEFLIAFPDYYTGQDLDANLLIIITALDEGNVQIRAPYTNTNINQILTAGSNYFNISGQLLADNMAIRAKAIHIQTSVNVSVHMIRVLPYLSVYSFMAIPMTSLSRKYIATCYTTVVNLEYGDSSSYVTVTAHTQTNVNLTLPFRRRDETKRRTSRDRTRTEKGDVVTVVLKANDVINFGVSKQDLTGTFIESDYPVFVTSGLYNPMVPSTRAPSFSFDTQDVIATTLPVSLWRKEFIATPFMNNKGYVLRITAGSQNTTVQIGTRSNTVVLSEPGDFHDEILATSIPQYISSDKPVSVVQFSNTQTNHSDKEGNSVMFHVQAMDFYGSTYVFTVPDKTWMPMSDKPVYNYIAITFKANFQICLTLDGRPLSNQVDRKDLFVGDDEYTVITIAVTPGFHRMHCSSPGALFGLVSYGFTRDSGYGYPVTLYYQNLA